MTQALILLGLIALIGGGAAVYLWRSRAAARRDGATAERERQQERTLEDHARVAGAGAMPRDSETVRGRVRDGTF